MHIDQVYFSGSFPTYRETPKTGIPEFAFIGRSNVGKSSLINMLTARKSIAKVSNTPGKTQLINYFLIDDSWYLVDLPGYGYAKLSKTKRKEFRSMIENFLVRKETIVCTFILIDVRHDLQAIDLEFINWCGASRLPIALVFTKMDKLRPNERDKNVKRLKNSLLEHWEALPEVFVTSSETSEGRDQLLSYIREVLSSLNLESS